MTSSVTDRLTELFNEAGYESVEPPLLHDADLFLDLAGEDLRRRLYLTSSAEGVGLCLRPDYTIPVALHHLTTGDPSRAAAYSYCGPVFRQRPGETGEFHQAGVESIGRTDTMDADADTLALALRSVAMFDITKPSIRIGDSCLFVALLESLSLPEVWRRRLARVFGDTNRVKALLDELSGRIVRPRPVYAGLLAALEDADAEDARTAVDDLLHDSGIPRVGGRSAAEIAHRFLEQASLSSGSESDRHAADILARFLAITGTPDEAALNLGELAVAEAPGMVLAVEQFAQRTAGLVRHGIDTDRVIFAADFGRRLDYYTGFVFELGDPDRAHGKPIAGGGRYDRLLSLISSRDGAGADVPAVGFALWLDRLGMAL